jgi:exodeoxyribonuclease-3
VRDLPKASDHAPVWIEVGPAKRKPTKKTKAKAKAKKRVAAPAKRRRATR